VKKVHIRNYILLIFASILLPACSLEKREGESAVKQPVELVIRASQGGSTRAMENVDDVIEVGAELAPSTRTELGNGPGANTNGDVNAGAEQQIRWVNDDQIMVWAEPAVSPQGYAFEQKVFSLAYYNHDYHSADFSAMVASTLDRDYDYTYYAIYPSPKYRNSQGQESAVSGITHNGTEITYTLSATQSGEYNPTYDIMWGKVTGAALIERDDSGSVDVWRQPELHMKHLLHMMRIRVPENRNLLGRDVKRLEITFPQAVVGGTAKVNVKTGEVVWSGQSNKVTIDLPDENLLNANGRYVWVQIKPGMINGDISFQMYDDYGVPTQVLSASVNKAFAGGHITPVNLTIPRSKYENAVYLDFVVDKNNLGEPLTNIKLSGFQFVEPFTDRIVSSIEIDRGNEDPKDVKYQTFSVVTVDGVEKLNNKSIGINYESNNALVQNRSVTLSTSQMVVEDTAVTPLSKPLSNSGVNKVNMVVPYLYYEDFSGVTSESSYNYKDWQWSEDSNTHKASNISSLYGWTGARWLIKKGSISVSAYTGTPVSSGTFAYGRIDSCPLSNLKNTKNIYVSFDYSGDLDEGGTMGFAADVHFGISETQGVINGTAKGNAVLPDKKDVITIAVADGGATGKISNLKIDNCSNISRLSWCNNITDSMTRSTAFFTVTNIKVSIAN
jgi:hypothetical protein